MYTIGKKYAKTVFTDFSQKLPVCDTEKMMCSFVINKGICFGICNIWIKRTKYSEENSGSVKIQIR